MDGFFLHAWDILLRFVGAGAGLLAGGDFTMLCALMILDYGTGIALSALGKSKKTEDGRFTFRVAALGLLQKVVMLCVILLAGGLDQIAGEGEWLRRAATGYYICNEGISLLENAALLGVPVPKQLRRALNAMREKESA